ncbi:site-specific integrase [bacterium]|nr:site-specific integrase [bacterium]
MTTRSLEDHEIKAIFEHIDGCNAKRNETLLIVGIGMALRASELVLLNVGDVWDSEKAKSYVTIRAETAKFNKERTIRIGDDIQTTVLDFMDWKVENSESVEKGYPLFVSQKGGHLTRQALFEIVKDIFAKAGINQSPHCLRKTGATLYYIESEYDLIATQQFLGHVDPSTTRRYIGLTSAQIAEYAERMSDHLFSAIHHGKIEKFDSRGNMSNFNLKEIPTAEMIVELQARSIDMTSAIEQMQEQRKPKVAAAGSKVVEFPRRE